MATFYAGGLNILQKQKKLQLRRPVHFLATGFASGISPVMPGTFGTLVCMPIVWLMQDIPILIYLFITLCAFVVGIWLCDVTCKETGIPDNQAVVWDEMVGYMLTMAAAPVGFLWLMLGFVLFRFFDIVKPWPIREIDQKVQGGLGVMLDDVIAGVFAWLVLQGVVLLMLFYMPMVIDHGHIHMSSRFGRSLILHWVS